MSESLTVCRLGTEKKEQHKSKEKRNKKKRVRKEGEGGRLKEPEKNKRQVLLVTMKI